jgi:hypothetical protein
LILVARTHKAGLKLLIDIVPNHITQIWKSNPLGERFAADDVTVEYKRDNNFYYIPNSQFEVPDEINPLNGEDNPLSDGKFQETPAKWTGNGSRMAKPDKNDWLKR